MVTGVELMDTGGTSPRVLTHRADQRIVPYTEWDLSTGTLVSPPTTSPEPSSYTGLQPALAYRWGSDGALIPESPVSSDGIPTAPPLGPIGDPNGGPTFTIWQPGIASLEIPGAPGQFPLQNTYNWATDIATWSPDERYLIEGIDITGLLASSQSPIPTRTTLAAHKWAQAPVFPVRDAGLQQAATIAASDSFTSGFLYPAAPVGPDGASWLGAAQRTGVLAVWRPDGRAVAIDADTADHAVTILDCASGRKLAILTPLTQSVAPNPTHEDGEMNVLRWSADGAQLALFDTTLGTVTIWGSSQLPHP